ncbi:lysylphosphatidylglycerol synthase transmembrane domain-containing protein [uncultured Aquimarina sp.]|uniref:lysylphosphatidylglycerol synthase transmembrane domain-containing protein n=1 Tax=uncultured Aquimarina sp. TaxID=575652 RepID=UPI0026299D6D|nr:lysylphosphatidylglycerol synthase transmembrane domain-containing protein [uncultured Aquimarina sp.]
MIKKSFSTINFWIKFLGFFLLAYLIYKVGWKETIISIRKISLLHILVALIIFWIAFFVKSIRWKIVSNSYGIKFGIFKALRVFFIGIFLGNITPGKLGDFGRLLYIKDELPNQKVGWSSLIMDRLFDLFCLLLFSFFALVYYQIVFQILVLPKNYWGVLFWLLLAIICSFVIFKNRKNIRNKIRPWWEAFSSHDLGVEKSFLSLILTVVSMILIYGVFNYVAWAMGIRIDHIGLFLGTFILGVLSLLPITILGIGVRETSLVLIFQLYNLPAEDAVALSLIIFLLQLLSFLPGAIWFYLSPIQLKQLRISKDN